MMAPGLFTAVNLVNIADHHDKHLGSIRHQRISSPRNLPPSRQLEMTMPPWNLLLSWDTYWPSPLC